MADTARRPGPDAQPAEAAGAVDPALLDLCVRGEGLWTAYQPFLDLRTDDVVAHEALLRGPAGGPYEAPIDLLAAAEAAGLEAALDCTAVRRHVSHAAEVFAGRRAPLFVNVEPTTLAVRLDTVVDIASRAPDHVVVVAELTERSLTANPAALHRAVSALRAAGCAIALDDVGANPSSLALIPVLRPEVVKLDMRVLREVGDAGTVAVAHAARAYAERTGADVVAEGIETERDRRRAIALGATLGQGWLWGRPSAEPRTDRLVPRAIRVEPPRLPSRRTPFDLLPPGSTQTSPRSVLSDIARDLERIALGLRVPPVILTWLQDGRSFRGATAQLYGALAERLPLVGVVGADLAAEPAPGVRGADLAPDDPLRSEWGVIILGPYVSTALIAREHAGNSAGSSAEYDYAVTYEPGRVAEAARLVLDRFVAGAAAAAGPAPRPAA